MARRPSAQTHQVLDVIAASGDTGCHGLAIARATGLKSGTLYPILMRLAERGMLEHEWKASEGRGRPPRHIYRLTGAGRAMLTDLSKTLDQSTTIEAYA